MKCWDMLQCIKKKGHILYDSIYMEYRLELKVLVAQWCLTLWDPMDCSPPGSPSLGFSRQEWWSGLLFPFPANIPDTRIKPVSPVSLALHTDSLLLCHWGSPLGWPKSVFRAFHNILRKTLNELFDQSSTSFTNEEAIAMKRYMTFWIAVCHLYGTAG